MARDFDMIVHQFYGGHDITIVPIADVHLGAEGCMEQEFIQFVKEIAETPDTYVILGGDLLDNAVKSSISNIYKATMRPLEAKKMMCRILEPIRDRILCIVSGNHERRSGKETDTDPTYDIAAKLDIEDRYRETIAFLKIQMGKPENEETGVRTGGAQRPVYSIVVTHGAGGGILTGASVNRAERFAYILDGCDAFITAHTHKTWNSQTAKVKIDLRNNAVTMQDFKVINATSWLRYVEYPVQKMMLPSSHCVQRLVLHGNTKRMEVRS